MGNILPIQITENIQKPIVIQNGLPQTAAVPIPIFNPEPVNLKNLPQINTPFIFGKNNEELNIFSNASKKHSDFRQNFLPPTDIFGRLQKILFLKRF